MEYLILLPIIIIVSFLLLKKYQESKIPIVEDFCDVDFGEADEYEDFDEDKRNNELYLEYIDDFYDSQKQK